jgi:hypothetical protein
MMKKQALLVAFILCLSLTPSAFAWGPSAHRIVDQIAEDRVGKNAKREVRKLVGTDTLASISNWADQTKNDETAPWDDVDIKVAGDGSHDVFDPDTQCEDGDRVIDKIRGFEKELHHTGAAKVDRAKALKYLVHFVGDIHQPLHCAERAHRTLSEDPGGNEVRVRYRGINKALKLHGVCGTQRSSKRSYSAMRHRRTRPNQLLKSS